MQLAVRPFVTTGVAIVGASVIAVAPITAPPDIKVPAVHTAEVVPAALATDLAMAVATLIAGGQDDISDTLIAAAQIMNLGIATGAGFADDALAQLNSQNAAVLNQVIGLLTALDPLAAEVPVLGPAVIDAAEGLVSGLGTAAGITLLGLQLSIAELAAAATGFVVTAANTGIAINDTVAVALAQSLIALATGIDAGTPVSGAITAVSVLVAGAFAVADEGLAGLNGAEFMLGNLAVQLNNIAAATGIAMNAEVLNGLLTVAGALAPVAALIPIAGPAATAAATTLLVQGSSLVKAGLVNLHGAVEIGAIAATQLGNHMFGAAQESLLALNNAIQQALGALDTVTPLAAPAEGPEALPPPDAESLTLTTHDGGATFDAGTVDSQPDVTVGESAATDVDGEKSPDSADDDTSSDSTGPGDSITDEDARKDHGDNDAGATAGDKVERDTDTNDTDGSPDSSAGSATSAGSDHTDPASDSGADDADTE